MIKKILGVLFISSSLVLANVSTAMSADIGFSVGVSGSAGLFQASGSETETDAADVNYSDSEELEVAYGSMFAEISVGRFSLGMDYVPGTIDTETSSRTDVYVTADGEVDTLGDAGGTYTVKAEFENFTSVYAELDIWNGFFITAGAMSIDVNTKEVLPTSVYGNTSLDGSFAGLGFKSTADNGVFVKLSVIQQEWDDLNLTASGGNTNSVTASLEGASAKLAVGKTF